MWLCLNLYCDSVRSFCMEKNLCRFFGVSHILYLYWCWRSNYQEGSDGMPLTALTMQFFCTCHAVGHVLFFISSNWGDRWLFVHIDQKTCTDSFPCKKTSHYHKYEWQYNKFWKSLKTTIHLYTVKNLPSLCFLRFNAIILSKTQNMTNL
jgi:hypothetical protein